MKKTYIQPETTTIEVMQTLLDGASKGNGTAPTGTAGAKGDFEGFSEEDFGFDEAY